MWEFIAERVGTKNPPGRSQSVRSSEEAGQRPWSEGTQEGGCAMPGSSDERPAQVPPEGAELKQAGEEPRRGHRRCDGPWAWTEPSVWTGRMLTALEEGVKGGKWFSLIDKVHSRRNLLAGFARVKSNGGSAGVDHQTIQRFEQRLDEHLERLRGALRTEQYRPQAIRRVLIPKPGSSEKRPLGIPTVRDRVVQTALRSVLEPIFETGFAEHSYGFRPGRSCRDALRRADELLERGFTWVVDADLKSYFDTIPHDRLLERVAEKVADGRVLRLIGHFLKQQVLDTAEGWTPNRGSPQGAVISPLLSNIYLDPLDHVATAARINMVRYADDFVLFCRSEAEAHRALELVQAWVQANGLSLHPEKTRVVDVTDKQGFDFLGYHFRRTRHWPSDKSQKKLRVTIRTKTCRTSGRSLKEIIADINQTTRGWSAYFKHCHPWHLGELDKWIRMRLRSILRKRRRGRGRGRGRDHQRWTNAFFTEQGLFSMTAAHATVRRSASR